MKKSQGLQSLFSQQLDRSVFAMYFLGAVVPLAAFAVVTQRYALPSLNGNNWETSTLIGSIVGVGALTLTSFLALRRLIQNALARMNSDNERLAKILTASRSLSDAPHSHVVAATAAGCARELAGARAAYVFLQSEADKSVVLCESSGESAQALFKAHGADFQELVEAAQEASKPQQLQMSVEPEAQKKSPLSGAAVVPFGDKSGRAGALLVAKTGAGAEFSGEELDALETLAGLVSAALQTADLQDAQRNFFTHVTEILVAALDSHLDERAGHSSAVAQLCNRIGRAMGLDDQHMQRLHFSALLHDIGMLKIPRAPHGSAKQAKKHPVAGYRMLSRIRLWEELAPIVQHHHEDFDGSGFPEGLKGRAIPLESRIIRVADAFDLMLRGNEGETPVNPEAALQRLQQGRGKQFDPEVLSIFATIVERGDLPPGM